MKRNFLFLYLNTGGGHISPAKVLKDAVIARYPDARVTLLHGFAPGQYISKGIWEKGYETACDLLPGAYSVTYDAFKLHSLQSFGFKTFFPGAIRHIEEKIRELDITDIVSFHFILTPCALKAVKRSGRVIPVTAVVTDPFSPHPIWFYPENAVRYVVSSPEVRAAALDRLRIAAHRIAEFPFFVDPSFYARADSARLKERYGFRPDAPVVLISGGGGGLPLSLALVREWQRCGGRAALAVVCGRNGRLKRALESLAAAHPEAKLRVYGFVPFMSDLVRLCDCAVTKAGASSLFELLAAKKPLIICSYIHGQELGNVRYAVRNRVGWFIRTPAAICDKIAQVTEDAAYYGDVRRRLDSLSPDRYAERMSAAAAYVAEESGSDPFR